MLKKYIIISALISLFVTPTRPIALFCSQVKNSQTFPLFGKPVFSPATTTRLINKILESRRAIFYSSCTAGGVFLGLAISALLDNGPRRQERARNFAALGIAIPLCTHGLLHLICMPTVGTLTMLAGE